LKPHVKIYLSHFGYTSADFIACEVCGSMAVDIHHIEARGMGGSKEKDTIENLQALCRYCHVKFGDKKHYKELLKEIHKERLKC
jgi:5-methylcytosine-specific restriction endonuclease McrA